MKDSKANMLKDQSLLISSRFQLNLCNRKINQLEAEVASLKAENASLKEQLIRRSNES